MMSKAVPQQSTTWAAETVHAPLLSLPAECLDASGVDLCAGDGDPRFLRPALVEQVFTAAGEVESAEWMLDQVLDDAAASDEEIGVGLDVEPIDGALESARWSLDQAVSALHDTIRSAAGHGVSVAVLAEASALEVEEVRAVLEAPGDAAGTVQEPAALAPSGAVRGELAPAV